MGSAKALLEFCGTRLVVHLAEMLRAGGCGPIYVVVGGPWRDAITDELAVSNPDTLVVINPQPERGMLSSLQTGLAGVSGSAVFTPVDLPLARCRPVEALLAAPAGHSVVVPTYNGQSGHPVLLRRPAVDAVLNADSRASARDILARFDRLKIRTEEPGICGNMNTPSDARAWTKEVS
ncbi:MAG: CTP:molybdopterin cytidylyltransferase MocA [Myxococcota bacterium]|jgi:CTP:molybdopterin cytidylyltransferase MocA